MAIPQQRTQTTPPNRFDVDGGKKSTIERLLEMEQKFLEADSERKRLVADLSHVEHQRDTLAEIGRRQKEIILDLRQQQQAKDAALLEKQNELAAALKEIENANKPGDVARQASSDPVGSEEELKALRIALSKMKSLKEEAEEALLEKDMAIRSLQEEGFHLRMANQPGHQKEEDLKQDFVRALLEAQLHLQLVENAVLQLAVRIWSLEGVVPPAPLIEEELQEKTREQLRLEMERERDELAFEFEQAEREVERIQTSWAESPGAANAPKNESALSAFAQRLRGSFSNTKAPAPSSAPTELPKSNPVVHKVMTRRRLSAQQLVEQRQSLKFDADELKSALAEAKAAEAREEAADRLAAVAEEPEQEELEDVKDKEKEKEKEKKGFFSDIGRGLRNLASPRPPEESRKKQRTPRKEGGDRHISRRKRNEGSSSSQSGGDDKSPQTERKAQPIFVADSAPVLVLSPYEEEEKIVVISPSIVVADKPEPAPTAPTLDTEEAREKRIAEKKEKRKRERKEGKVAKAMRKATSLTSVFKRSHSHDHDEEKSTEAKEKDRGKEKEKGEKADEKKAKEARDAKDKEIKERDSKVKEERRRARKLERIKSGDEKLSKRHTMKAESSAVSRSKSAKASTKSQLKRNKSKEDPSAPKIEIGAPGNAQRGVLEVKAEDPARKRMHSDLRGTPSMIGLATKMERERELMEEKKAGEMKSAQKEKERGVLNDIDDIEDELMTELQAKKAPPLGSMAPSDPRLSQGLSSAIFSLDDM